MARGGRNSRSGDVIYGTNGNDILSGVGGLFDLIGGRGDDTYVIDDDGDKAVEKKDSGTDHVISYVDFVLGNHVENLTLEGTDNLSGTGNGVQQINAAQQVSIESICLNLEQPAKAQVVFPWETPDLGSEPEMHKVKQ